ncbi:HlyD family secretion protein [Ferrimonas balearica]|uniref:HlyD family secretion protein n=1 Tax=Ferrimonas balearica TaxID=44012 RepID=UPI001C95E45E|nr:HlyD family secretion protein [Ferrimonas balearica]MBY6223955.1 HlyD family secretion protein [Ferrimonas balearica]
MGNKHYQWGLYLVLGTTLAFAAFLVGSDTQAPFTTQAQLHRTVARIAPEVSGNVLAVAVKNGQHVKRGDALLSLDDSDYQLALEQAKADLAQAHQNHEAREQELNVAKATLVQKQQTAANAKLKLTRNSKLVSQGLITQEALDDSQNAATVADAAVTAAEAEIARLKVQLSDRDGDAAVELAEAKLAQARLDLARTRMVAPVDGIVTNLQLQSGSYLNAGSPALFLVSDGNSWISADFNEKGIAHLSNGTPVWVAFDALPGQLFKGQIANREQAVYDASSANGELASVTNDNRWIREQQKIRTRIEVPGLDPALISGARASIMVYRPNTLWGSVSKLWMQVIAQLRYLY